MNRNQDLRALQDKVAQLALSSRYKSEFLANLSHELRTPLNSLLILGQLLAENSGGNLTPQQVEYAQTICMAGDDLVALTNEILDLAKVESGTVTLNLTHEGLAGVRDYVERTFRRTASDRGLGFTLSMQEGLPATIRTDIKRLRQILQNLLSNAFKFTPTGTVTFDLSIAGDEWMRRSTDAQPILKISVADTGIGIAKDKQQVIFEAFKQADGTTDRRFGGTGLGLAISADLARLLGGEIRVESTPGAGSTFTLFLPLNLESEAPLAASIAAPAGDRASIRPGDRVLLLVAEDAKLCALLVDHARVLGYKALCAPNAHTALVLATEFGPNAILVAVTSGATDNWVSVNLLKQDPDTRHIPASVVCFDDRAQTFVCLGSLGSVTGPSRIQALREALRKLSRFMEQVPRNLLVANASKTERSEIVQGMAADGPHVIGAATGKQALKKLGKPGIDGVIVGRSLSGMRPLELVRQLFHSAGVEQMAVVVQGAARAEIGAVQSDGHEIAEMLVLRRVSSAAALLEQIGLCLNDAKQEMPGGYSWPISVSGKLATPLANTKVLLVDDDTRDAFALTSALEQHGMRVSNAASGLDCIELLQNNPGTEIILMDMMMPDQDGYQTIRQIRGLERFAHLPIIAVTAKAMKGDREKCIAAGASDYVSKPVDVVQLLAVMGMWLADKSASAQRASAQIWTSPAWMA
ncbi:MAG: response regulator [Burkholderiales bacterium]